MELPSASWVNLALQIPLALVIVFLVIRFLLHLEKLNDKMFDFIGEQQDKQAVTFEKQQENQANALGRLAEEIKSNRLDTVKEVASLTGRVDAVIEKMLALQHLLMQQDNNKKK